ncbi:MAG TPA: SDR family NAD(P)-dependent oxidoreductase [Thermoleophilaceae bacterium]|jgi:NAD(P)-dependent dehydrogenase (short-subunit alcohol dehydrogenase family)
MSARVIITGAASGIGEAAAAELRRRGAQVVGLDINGSGEIIQCDVRDQESVERAVREAIERLGGGVDVLINNAGVGFSQSAGLAPDDKALAVFDVNMIGPWRMTAAALPALRESRGRVVNVASGLAHVTAPFATAYCMSKRAVVAYSDALRLEHGDAITVTTVYPGYIKTPIHTASNEDGFALDGLVPEEPLSGAAATLVRAALGRPARDLATTRQGAVGYALARRAPRRLMDWLTLRTLRRAVSGGSFDRSKMAREFVERLRA